MSMPNDPENSKPAAPQSAPDQTQPDANVPTPPTSQTQPTQPSQPTQPTQASQPTQPTQATQASQPTQPTQQYPYTAPQATPQPAPATADPAAQQPWRTQASVDRAALPPYNVMALIAFIGAFVIPVVGIVCGHITLGEYRRGLPERGREYALAGMILGYVFTAIWVVLAIVWMVFAFTHLGHASGVVQRGGSGVPNFGGGSGGGRGFQFSTPQATPGS